MDNSRRTIVITALACAVMWLVAFGALALMIF
jgi:hypothetical protein